jgi:hypothetical protein
MGWRMMGAQRGLEAGRSEVDGGALHILNGGRRHGKRTL